MKIMSKINEYLEHQKAIDELVKDNGNEMIQDLFNGLFTQYKNLDVLFIYGYTPSFNDGDPCYHRQYVEVESGDITDRVDEYLDLLDEDEEVEYNVNLTYDETVSITDSVDELEDLFERIYDTGYYIIARREEDGSIDIVNGDYDCGY